MALVGTVDKLPDVVVVRKLPDRSQLSTSQALKLSSLTPVKSFSSSIQGQELPGHSHASFTSSWIEGERDDTL